MAYKMITTDFNRLTIHSLLNAYWNFILNQSEKATKMQEASKS